MPHYMKHIITLLLCMCGLLAGCGKTSLESPKGRYKFAMERLAAAQTPEQKFFALGPAAKESFEAGKVEDAQKYAQDLMVLLPDFKDSTDYGGAMSDANIVLGRVALKKGQVEEAKRYLLAAGRSPTSPYLANYGPNMGLAKDLLEKGDRQTVLEYLDLCRKFWSNGSAQLTQWTQQIKDGKTPDFKGNLSI